MAWNWGQIFEYAAPIVGGLLEGKGAKDAAKESAAGSAAAIAEQRRQFDTIMGMQAPYQQVGTQALNSLARLYGYSPGVTPQMGAPQNALNPAAPYGVVPGSSQQAGLQMLGSAALGGGPLGVLTAGVQGVLSNNTSRADHKNFAGAIGDLLRTRGVVGSAPKPSPVGTPGIGDMTGAPLPTGMGVFTSSPDYEFRRGEGMRGIENSFAARGGAASGNALRALNEFNSNLASTEFGNYFNRQAALAGIGQTATNNASGFAQNTGINIGNLLQNGANARASGIEGGTNALTNTLQNLLATWSRNRTPTNNMSL